MSAVCVLHLESTEFPHVAEITQFHSDAQFKGWTLAVVRNTGDCLLTGIRLNELLRDTNLPACPLAYSTGGYAISNGIARALKP